MRPGRIDRIVFVSPPDADARKAIFSIQLKKIPHKPDEINLDELAAKSDGLTGAEITSVCREACLAAMKESTFPCCLNNATESIFLTPQFLFFRRYRYRIRGNATLCWSHFQTWHSHRHARNARVFCQLSTAIQVASLNKLCFP